MNNRDELDAIEMLLRAMMGEERVIEHMESEGQQKAIRNTMMAKKMNPSKEVWEKLGFSFSEIPNDDTLCQATLPDGWTIKPTDHAMWNEIFDSNNAKRGAMFYKSSFYDRDAHMYLESRYKICTKYLDDNYESREVYFGNEQEVLFIAGQIIIPEKATRQERIDAYEKEEKLRKIAEQFANENYPDWENVQAYWDDGKNYTRSLAK